MLTRTVAKRIDRKERKKVMMMILTRMKPWKKEKIRKWLTTCRRTGLTDKNCPGIIHTIVGGPPARSRSNSDSISSSSSKDKGKQICQVEVKRLKVDNTITFTDEDFEGIEMPH